MATQEIMDVLATYGNTEGHDIDDLFSNDFRDKAKKARNVYYIRDEGNEFYKVGSDGMPNFDQTQDYTKGILCLETGEQKVIDSILYKKIITADGKVGWMRKRANPTPFPPTQYASLVKQICIDGELSPTGQLRKKKQKAKRSKRSKSSKQSKSSKHSKRSKSSKHSKHSKKPKKRNTKKKSSKKRRTKRR